MINLKRAKNSFHIANAFELLSACEFMAPGITVINPYIYGGMTPTLQTINQILPIFQNLSSLSLTQKNQLMLRFLWFIYRIVNHMNI